MIRRHAPSREAFRKMRENRLAMAAPSPEEAPVITVTCPFSFLVSIFYFSVKISSASACREFFRVIFYVLKKYSENEYKTGGDVPVRL